MTHDIATHASKCFVVRGAEGLVGQWCTAYYLDALAGAPDVHSEVLARDLCLYQDDRLSIHLTPFDGANPQARVVLVGITPGRHQFELAVRSAGQAIRQGRSVDDAIAYARVKGGFAGEMRNILIRMLDDIGLHTALGIQSCSALFHEQSDLTSNTSAICHAVFTKGGGNYRGSPRIGSHPVLRAFATQVLAENISLVPGGLVIPLGPVAAEGVRLAGVNPSRVLEKFPHPSPANRGRNGPRAATFLEGKAAWSEKVASFFR